MKNYFNDCIDCKERYMGCHSKCEKYKKARVEKDKDDLNMLAKNRYYCNMRNRKKVQRCEDVACV